MHATMRICSKLVRMLANGLTVFSQTQQ